MNPKDFNPTQLSTFAEAADFRRRINYAPQFYKNGLQILPWWGSVTNATSGIYIPEWTGGLPPQNGPAQFYAYRFNNGFAGMNPGLVRDLFSRYPNSPAYVLGQLLIEAQQGART